MAFEKSQTAAKIARTVLGLSEYHSPFMLPAAAGSMTSFFPLLISKIELNTTRLYDIVIAQKSGEHSGQLILMVSQKVLESSCRT